MKKNPYSSASLGLLASGLILSTATSVHADVVVINSATAPVAGADDQFYLPGNVDETDAMTVDGTNDTSGENDLLTYVANDRSSKGMSFTTGPNALGYTLGSITVQHIGWNVFTTNGTFYTVAPGNTFDIRIGTISGNTLTPIYTTFGTYGGTRIPAAGIGADSGTGTFFTFDLSGDAEQAGIGTLAPNTTYFFEIASGNGNPFLELNNTAADGYAGGSAFRGDDVSVVDADGTVTAPPNGGDIAFHADLTPLSEAPVFATQPQDTQGDVGGVVTLTSLAASDPAPSYQWQKSADGVTNWTDIPDATSSTFQIFSAVFADNGFYRVIATSGTEPITSATAQLTISYPDPQILTQPASTSVEAGSNVTLSVEATGVGELAYQWYKDAEIIDGATSDTLELTNMQPADAGDYDVDITDPAGEADGQGSTYALSSPATVGVYGPWSGLVSHDPFAAADGYALGSLATQDPAIAGYTDPWEITNGFGPISPVVLPGSLAYANPLYLGSSGDSVSTPADTEAINATNSGRVGRLLDSQLVVSDATTGTRYLSWLFRSGLEKAAPDPQVYQTLALFNGVLGTDANRDFEAGIALGDFSTTNFAFRLNNNAGMVGNLGVPSDANVHLFVAKIELSDTPGGDSVTVWIDPALGSGDPAGGVTVTGADLLWDRIALSDYASDSSAWDEIRWGSTFDSVTLNPNPPDNFATWIGGYPVGLLNGFDDDADGDGIENGLENVFGTDPSVANQGITQVAASGSIVTFQHPQSGFPASDVTAAYRWTTDLASFHDSGAESGGTTVTLTPALNTPSAGTTTVTAIITGTLPAKLFLVLEATQAP